MSALLDLSSVALTAHAGVQPAVHRDDSTAWHEPYAAPGPLLNHGKTAALLGGTSLVQASLDSYRAPEPDGGAAAPLTKSEQRARADVAVHSVSDKRAMAEHTLAAEAHQTKTAANQILTQIENDKLPHGAHGQLTNDGGVTTGTITEKDAHGNVTQTVRVERDASGKTMVETIAYETVRGTRYAKVTQSTVDGTDSAQTVDATVPVAADWYRDAPRLDGKGGFDVERAERYWGQKGGLYAGAPNATFKTQTIARDGDDLRVDDRQQRNADVSWQSSTFSRTTSLDDAGPLAGQFHDGSVDELRTQVGTGTVSFDGQSLEGTRTTSAVTLSQGSGNYAVQATSKQDGPVGGAKQWQLEIASGDTYQSQRFVEGQPDATIVTTRTADGSSVDETTTGKWFDKDGKLHDVTGQSTSRYGRDGRLIYLDADATDADGLETQQHFERVHAHGGDRTTMQVTQTDADGNATTHVEREQTRDTKHGPELVAVTDELKTADGDVVSSVDAHGRTTTLDGRSVRGRDDLSDTQRALIAQTNVSFDDQIRQFAAARLLGANAPEVGEDGGKPDLANPRRWFRAAELGLEPIAEHLDSKILTSNADSVALRHALARIGTSNFGLVQSVIGIGQSLQALIGGGSADEKRHAIAELADGGGGALKALIELHGGAGKLPGLCKGLGLLGYAPGTYDLLAGVVNGSGDQILKGGFEVASVELPVLAGELTADLIGGAWGGPAGVAVGALVFLLTAFAGDLFGGDEDPKAKHEIHDIDI